VAWAWAWEWDQGDGAACAPKSERISCLASFLDEGTVVGVVFTGGAWKSSEKRSFADDEDTGAGAGTGVEVT
jgi:hypothetical protein